MSRGELELRLELMSRLAQKRYYSRKAEDYLKHDYVVITTWTFVALVVSFPFWEPFLEMMYNRIFS